MPKFHLGFSDGSSTTVTAFSAAAVLTMHPNAVTINGIDRWAKSAEVKARGAIPPIKVVQNPRCRYLVKRQNLTAAIAELGLELPVVIRFNSRHGRTNGNYRRQHTHHDIMLKSYLDHEQASSTLWHELTHAMQAERAGSAFAWSVLTKQQRKTPYRRRPIEVEARAMSKRKADQALCAHRAV